MKSAVFDFKDYKVYLNYILEVRAETKKGQRSKLAAFIGCQPAYLSQVFNGTNDLSPEQAQNANEFLSHTPSEAKYFLNLVLWQRSGTKALKSYYEDELKKQKDERLSLKNRVTSNRTLSEVDQAKYYGSWYFAAIHVAVSINHLKKMESIAQVLRLPQNLVNEVLEFLVQIGILKRVGYEYRQGEASLYLDAGSAFIQRHHLNWRVRAIQSLDHVKKEDLHYSGVITCSIEDISKIREAMVAAIQSIRSQVKESKDETLYFYTMDLVGLLESSENQ